MKKFDKFFVANLKRTAQMVNPMVKEKQKLIAEIEENNMRIASLDSQINSLDSHIKEVTGGYGVEDLIERKVYVSDKMDKDGKSIKTVKWELKYPETIIPIENEQNDASNEVEEVEEAFDKELNVESNNIEE